MAEIYLSLGSNLGNRMENLRAAIAALPASGVTIKRVSNIYETEPVDYLEQSWFLNCAVAAETELAAVELLRALRDIEARLGSAKAFAKGPRLLDLDILLFGHDVVNTPELQIPHPRMAERRFVLVPLSEIAPGVRHPVNGRTAAEMLQKTADRSVVNPLNSAG